MGDKTHRQFADEMQDSLRLSAMEPATPAALERLATFGDLLLRWNESVNLTAAVSLVQLATKHFIDAFAASAVIPRQSAVLDVGSGGGLPAIPLALLRDDLILTLAEPTAKKLSFLRTSIRELALGKRVSVFPHRVDDTSQRTRLPALFDVAMSRATFEPARWRELGTGLVKPQGLVLIFCSEEAAAQSLASGCVRRYAPHRFLAVAARP